MKIVNKSVKNANIVLVADKLHSSFISANFFPFLPSPNKIVQIPPFGLLDFGNYNFIVDVENRRVTITDLTGNITESKIPQMASHFLAEIKGPEIKVAGFNYLLELAFDGDFGKYSAEEFTTSKIKALGGDGLVGAGIKVFIKKDHYLIALDVQSVPDSSSIAIVNANFHYGTPGDIDWKKDFVARYQDIEEYMHGIFG